MPPKNYYSQVLYDWNKAMTVTQNELAKTYIEENIDLLEEDIEKFIQECPELAYSTVVSMLKQAGIEVPVKCDKFTEHFNKYFDEYKVYTKDLNTLWEKSAKWVVSDWAFPKTSDIESASKYGEWI